MCANSEGSGNSIIKASTFIFNSIIKARLAFIIELKKILFFSFYSYFCLLDICHKFSGKTMRQALTVRYVCFLWNMHVDNLLSFSTVT